jgi:hypothetical protein
MNTTSIRSRFLLPPSPTDALPGSVEKVRVLAGRARLHVSLWHPQDAKLPTDDSQADARAAFLAVIEEAIIDAPRGDGALAGMCLAC